MFWLTLIVTVVLTTLLVKGASWIEKSKATHPGIYKNRRTIYSLVLMLMQLTQF